MNSRGNEHENSEELLSSTQFNVALTLVQKGAQVEIEHLKKQAAERVSSTCMNEPNIGKEQQLLEENRRLKAELVLLRSKMVSGSTTTEKREEDHPISPESRHSSAPDPLELLLQSSSFSATPISFGSDSIS